MANTVNIIMGKIYPTNVNSFMFKAPANIAAIMGKTAEAAPAVAKVASLIQHCLGTSSNTGIGYLAAGERRGAERFLASETFYLKAASVAISRANTPGSHCWMELWSVTGSLPATMLATSNKYTAASLPTSPVPFKGFTFNTQPNVASGTNYAIALAANNGFENSNYIILKRSGHGVINYPNGHYVEQAADGTWAKGVGAGFDIDMGFRIFGEKSSIRSFYEASNPVTNVYMRNIGANQNTVGVNFLASHNYKVTSAEIMAARYNTPASTCWLELWDVSGSTPDTLLGTTAQIDQVASWTQSVHDWRKFTFSPAITVASNTRYVLSFNSNAATHNTDNFVWRCALTLLQNNTRNFTVEKDQDGTWQAQQDEELSFRINGISHYIPPSYEDFTKYTEDDVGGYLTVTKNSIDWAAMPWNTDSKVSYDFGTDYFDGNFEIQFEFQIDVDNNSYMGAFILANEVEGSGYWNSNQPCIRSYWNGVTNGLWLESRTSGGNNSDSSSGLTLGTNYFITVTRDDDGGAGTGQVVMTIRTGSHLGPTFDTVTVNCNNQVDYRYLLSCTSHNAGGATTSSGTISNYKIISIT